MSDQPTSRPPRAHAQNRPLNDEAVNDVTATALEITGPVATPNPTRGGEDTRRRGWFWHWNSIVTQYAPLIGLKGVGLLNSYTVWTDRREESPHRGYAFPSQQSEADFYGEDRAELMTINKLLVALDLIEIRKEMVLRIDEQGRRWKVPHNFYRVKDHDDGSSLNSRDVLKVAALADRDAAVYRYVRRVFSPKFAPIDHNNVWARILEDVRETEVWQRLASKAATDEQRASDRTKAGHAARKSSFILPADVDNTTTSDAINDSETDRNKKSLQTSVEPTNKGSGVDVDPGNTGLKAISTTDVEPINTAPPTDVDQTNRTYNQYPLTTTTTTETGSKRRNVASIAPGIDIAEGISHTPVTTRQNAVTDRRGAGPSGEEAPFDAPGENRAVQAFEDANGRRATAAERHLLAGLSKRFDAAARNAHVLHMASGWDWVTAGIYEAVEAGSTFVAPRRLREILTRWERDGLPESEGGPGNDQLVSRQQSELGANATRFANRAKVDSARSNAIMLDQSAPDIDLPHGYGSRRTWEYAVGLLGSALAQSTLAELVHGSAIVGFANGEVTIAVPREGQAEQLTGEYRDLVARKLSEAMGRPVQIAALVSSEPQSPGSGSADQLITTDSGSERSTPRVVNPAQEDVRPNFMVIECGLPSPQVWAAIIDEVVVAGEVSRLNVETWLRSSQLIGRSPTGALIVGAPHSLAQRRIESRFIGPVSAAIHAVLGIERQVEIVVARDWMAEHHGYAGNREANDFVVA